MIERRNINRGYQKLNVWQDAANLYLLTSKIFGKFQYELRRVGANQIASVDSVHRNIAEGYCRRSLNEYLQFLNIALASLESLQHKREKGEWSDSFIVKESNLAYGKDDFE